jgi:hypothetical protein
LAAAGGTSRSFVLPPPVVARWWERDSYGPISVVKDQGGYYMQAWCKYCRCVTPPAPARPGRPRLCSICLRPYEPATETRPPGPGMAPTASTTLQEDTQSLPAREPERQVTSRDDADPPHATQTATGIICPYLRDRNNAQTVHPVPHKRNACYARLCWQERWWSPYMGLTPTQVTQRYQASFCFGTYGQCPHFRPVGTPNILTEHTVSPNPTQ